VRGNLLNRLQAMAMLKELVDNNLVDPSYVSLGKRTPTNYQIQIKCDYNKKEIEAHAKKHGLTIEEDKEKLYLLIFKP
jgi:hypothetical protein